MADSDKLAVAPRGERELVMTRAFDASRERVFDALTRPELLREWLGVRGGWTLPVCEMELSVGGAYRFVWRHPERGEMGMGGVVREVEAPERVVWTERFDQPWYPGESLVTHALAERDGRTTVTATIAYESRAARDGVLGSGMERGVAESYDRLDAILEDPGERP